MENDFLVLAFLGIAGYLVYKQQQSQQQPIDWTSTLSQAGDFLKTSLQQFADAITNFEGSPGDLNYRNNNPGNLRYAGQAGAIGQDSRGFAIFDTWESGLTALQRQITLTASRHPNWTIVDFVNSYAPPSDNNPNNLNYANSIATALGVPTSATLGSLELV